MHNSLKNTLRHKALSCVGMMTALLLAACASIGNPSGGPRDEDPPRPVRANPAKGTLGFSGNRITIDFNELVNVKDPTTKVVVSPPSAMIPRVSSQGRRVSVEFRDTLLPNTTYTIDFGNAIEDNNEGNKLQGFTYTFSTGEEIDTMRISGMVLDALTLEPQQGILVGAYTDLGDSAFVSRRFERVAKTDDRGRFTIYGLKGVPYRVYALNDMDGDMKYANPEEDLAFLPISVTPTSERVEVTDTIFNLLTGAVDTTIQRMRTRYLPNDLLLRSYNSGRRQQFVAQYQRPDSARILLRFNTAAPAPPVIDIVGRSEESSLMMPELNATNDTITYWLPPALAAVDTLRLSVGYARLDSLAHPVQVYDTLSLITPRRKAQKEEKASDKKKGEEETKRPPSLMTMHLAGGSQVNVGAPVTVEFSRPVAVLDTLAIKVEEKVDTLWAPLSLPLRMELPDSTSPRRMRLLAPWAYGTTYRILADTLAVTDIYGVASDPWSQEFSIPAENEYGTLKLNIRGVPDSIPAYVDLLDKSESVVRRAPVEGGVAYMPDLRGGKYYLRLVIDSDGDGRWTPGDFENGRLPEVAFYCPKLVNVRKNWDSEQDWDVFATAVDEMKPYAIKKNRPERIKGEKDPAQLQEEEEEAAAEEEARRTGNYNPFQNAKSPRKL